jgi:hypothetical protein
MIDLTLPDILDRKKNPVAPATPEERAAFAAMPAAAEPVHHIALGELDETTIEHRKVKAAGRIAKLLAKKALKNQRHDIPDEYLAWDATNLRFYDRRVRAARKLAEARKRLGLEV